MKLIPETSELATELFLCRIVLWDSCFRDTRLHLLLAVTIISLLNSSHAAIEHNTNPVSSRLFASGMLLCPICFRKNKTWKEYTCTVLHALKDLINLE